MTSRLLAGWAWALRHQNFWTSICRPALAGLWLTCLSGMAQPSPGGGGYVGGDSLRLDQMRVGRWATGHYAQGNQLKQTGQGAAALFIEPGHSLTLAEDLSQGGLIDLSWMQAEGGTATITLGGHQLTLAPAQGKQTQPAGTLTLSVGAKGNADASTRQRIYPTCVAARGPGLWQHLTLTLNRTTTGLGAGTPGGIVLMIARLNGVPIQAGVDLGITGAGPWPVTLFVQQGPLALRHVRRKIIDPSGGMPRLGPIAYEVSVVRRLTEAPTDSMMAKPRLKGTSATLSYHLAGRPNEFALRMRTSLEIPRPGQYRIDFLTGGGGQLKVGDFPMIERGASASPRESSTPLDLDLEARTYPVELLYYKTMSSITPSLALTISGPGVLDHPLHAQGSSVESGAPPPYPLSLETRPKLQRCFMRSQDGRMHPYTLMVGTPTGLHYALDLAQGTLLAVWRGDFADVGGLWRDRGSDQLAHPRGAVVSMAGGPGWALMPGEGGSGAAWPDTLDPARWQLSGYQLDADGYPTILYQGPGGKVSDYYRPSPDGLSLTRTLTWSGAPASARVRVLATPALSQTAPSGPSSTQNRSRRAPSKGEAPAGAPYAQGDGCLIREAPAGAEWVRPMGRAVTATGGKAAGQGSPMLIAPLDGQGRLSYTLWF